MRKYSNDIWMVIGQGIQLTCTIGVYCIPNEKHDHENLLFKDIFHGLYLEVVVFLLSLGNFRKLLIS